MVWVVSARRRSRPNSLTSLRAVTAASGGPPAERRDALVASLLEPANVLKLRLNRGRSPQALAREVLDSIPTAPRPWLLIYDNVASPEDIRDLIPAPGTRLLITSRWTDWSDLAVEIELPLWDEATANRLHSDTNQTKRVPSRSRAALPKPLAICRWQLITPALTCAIREVQSMLT